MSRVITFEAVDETAPGDDWRAQFERRWPVYREWFLRDGDGARPTYAVARRALEEHMPELVEPWEELVGLAGGGDVAARMLALYSPPAIILGCSQAVYGGALVRNYDFHPDRFEGVVACTALRRRVVGVTDCLWGLVDGINDAGLAVSLAFGGRPEVGEGFGIPIVLRYLLETCATVAEARGVLERLPIQVAYNLTLLDAGGDAVTAYVGPGAPARFVGPVATNHQEDVSWIEHAEFSHTLERDAALAEAAGVADEESFIAAFLAPPLYATEYDRGFGTLYTAIYRPGALELELRWPDGSWTQSLGAFTPGVRSVTL